MLRGHFVRFEKMDIVVEFIEDFCRVLLEIVVGLRKILFGLFWIVAEEVVVLKSRLLCGFLLDCFAIVVVAGCCC